MYLDGGKATLETKKRLILMTGSIILLGNVSHNWKANEIVSFCPLKYGDRCTGFPNDLGIQLFDDVSKQFCYCFNKSIDRVSHQQLINKLILWCFIKDSIIVKIIP